MAKDDNNDKPSYDFGATAEDLLRKKSYGDIIDNYDQIIPEEDEVWELLKKLSRSTKKKYQYDRPDIEQSEDIFPSHKGYSEAMRKYIRAHDSQYPNSRYRPVMTDGGVIYVPRTLYNPQDKPSDELVED